MLTLQRSDKTVLWAIWHKTQFLYKNNVLNAKFWREKLDALSGKLNYFIQQET